MKRCLNLFLAVALGASVISASPGEERSFLIERDVMVPMRDGVKLAAHVFRPKREGRYPVILLRTPYGKPNEKYGEATRYTQAGYVMVTQDCRGKGTSGGEWDPFAHDAADGVDTQKWIGAQNWCDGRIGLMGGSYLGWTQWASAPEATEFLVCAAPMVPFGDVYRDAAYQGGAFQLALMMGWGMSVGGVIASPDNLAKAYQHLPLQTFGDQFDPPIPYLNDWVTHTHYDGYWKQRSIDHRYAEIDFPILNIGGWYDIFSKATVDLVDRVREQSNDRLARRNQFVVMGPWAHAVGTRTVGQLDYGEVAARDLGDLQFKWFEYWLKDKETRVEDWPAYHLFIMGENAWRGEQEWPLARTRYTPVYLRGNGKANTLHGDGRLAMQKPTTSEPEDIFVYDPENPVPTTGGNNLVGASAGPQEQNVVEQRPDVLVYTSSPLTESMEVTGPVKMILYATSSATNTDFTAKLVDVHPDGKAFNLCDGIIRARYRDGMEDPKLLQPGAIERYEIDLWVTANLFKKGHQIRVEISSSNFPRFDRNPNTGLPFGTSIEVRKATQAIHHSGEHASHLLLPVIPRR